MTTSTERDIENEVDTLLRASLAATTDAERVELGGRIARIPDVIARISERLHSTTWETRRIAMHFVTRLSPPPDALTPAIVNVLARPLSEEPFGEETVLSLVIAGAVAPRVTAQRRAIELRLGWIERAIAIGSDEVADHPGEPTQFDIRASIVKKLALDTLAKLDAAIAVERERRAKLVALIAETFASSPGEAITMVALEATKHHERDAWTAGMWEDIAATFARSSPKHRDALEHALQALRQYASYSTSGGEGLARMAEVHEVERRIALSPDRS
jgi:hypothetical protein